MLCIRPELQIRKIDASASLLGPHIKCRFGHRIVSGPRSYQCLTTVTLREETSMEQSVCISCMKLYRNDKLTSVTILAKADDEILANALRQYHRELLSNNKKILARLFSEHGITMRYDVPCLIEIGINERTKFIKK
jgi:hypothetical protein